MLTDANRQQLLDMGFLLHSRARADGTGDYELWSRGHIHFFDHGNALAVYPTGATSDRFTTTSFEDAVARYTAALLTGVSR